MIGLVLEGGGARGSYHVGAYKAFRKKHIKFDAIVGTSIGSINAALLASNDYKKLYNVWSNASSKQFFDIDDELLKAVRNRKITREVLKSGIKTTWSIIKNLGIDTKHLRRILENNIDEKKLRNSKVDFGLCTYSLTDKKPIKLFKKDIPYGKVVEYLIASSYYPAFKFEKIIDEKYYIDGGVYDRCPVDMLIDKKFDEIYVVKAYTWDIKKVKSDTSKIIYVKPKSNLGSTILFDKEVVQENFKRGYYDTLKILNNYDGKNYYIKYKSEEYYEEYIDKKKLIFISGKNTKQKLIKIVEELCNEFKIAKYRVYNINILLRLIRKEIRMNKKHKYYKVIMNLNIRWF